MTSSSSVLVKALVGTDAGQPPQTILVEILDRNLARLAMRFDQEAHPDARLWRFRHGRVHEPVAIEVRQREAFACRPEMKIQRPARFRDLRVTDIVVAV